MASSRMIARQFFNTSARIMAPLRIGFIPGELVDRTLYGDIAPPLIPEQSISAPRFTLLKNTSVSMPSSSRTLPAPAL